MVGCTRRLLLGQDSRQQAGRLSDDDANLLSSVITLVEKTIYSSMDDAHQADIAALDDAIQTASRCNADIADRQSPEGDLGILQQAVLDKQTALNTLQDDVDLKTDLNNTAYNELETHMQHIAPAPACPGLPARTMPALDVFFESSDYVIWYTAQQAAYTVVRDAFVAADTALENAIQAYNIQRATRDVQYCDWKNELEAACAAFDVCFSEASDFYTNTLVPSVTSAMNNRIEVKKAGDTLIHQINFLLGNVAEQETPSIDTSRYEITFPDLPSKGLCDLSPLDADDWVPVVDCSPKECQAMDLSLLRFDLPRPAVTDIQLSGDVLRVQGSGSLNLWTGRDGTPIAWFDAPQDETYTFEVDSRFLSGSSQVILVMSVYDGPDGSGVWPFTFGPRTWDGDGVGVQLIPRGDYTGGVNPGRGEDPRRWWRTRIVRRPGPTWDFSYRPAEGGDWVTVRTGVVPPQPVQGTRIALGLKQSGGSSEAEFRNLVVHAGEPSACQSS